MPSSASAVDPAILSALSLSPNHTTAMKHGGSKFTETWKFTGRVVKDGELRGERVFFVKTGKGRDAEEMFAGEHASLNAIHSIIPHLCPQSHAHGLLSDKTGSFLATDFLHLTTHPRATPSSPHSLARSLAHLHSTPAPLPSGFDTPVFGFPVSTYCGSTPQHNTYSTSWCEFFGQKRLGHILSLAESRHGKDSELSRLGENLVEIVVPRLLSEGHLKDASTEGNIKPVVVHGDLWSGNAGWGKIDGSEEEIHEVVFDAAACWAHSEYEWGIMRMFGGFGGEFERVYTEVKGWDEPVEEADDRVLLYELYHHLNHYVIFGSDGYKSSGMEIMRRLVRKYC